MQDKAIPGRVINMPRVTPDRRASLFLARTSWRSVAFTFFAFVAFFYIMFTLINNRYSVHASWYERPAPCETPKYVMDEIISLTFGVSEVLMRLNVSHIACYGTLWGVLRYGRSLPWDNNGDFCVLKSEIEKVPRPVLDAAFNAGNMEISYNRRHGEYRIVRGPATVLISIFYVTAFNEVLHDGFEHRFLWFFQDTPVSFPHRLIEPPFRKLSYHGRTIPVPNDDMEILKYLYKKDWWLEKPPPGCKVNLVK